MNVGPFASASLDSKRAISIAVQSVKQSHIPFQYMSGQADPFLSVILHSGQKDVAEGLLHPVFGYIITR